MGKIAKKFFKYILKTRVCFRADSSLCRTNDVDAIAYQPGKEEDELRINADASMAKSPSDCFDNFRRLYSHRRQPSLSPRSSSRNLNSLHDRNIPMSQSGGSLSPYSAAFMDRPQPVNATTITIQSADPIPHDPITERSRTASAPIYIIETNESLPSDSHHFAHDSTTTHK